MKTEFLKNLGIEEETIKAIMAENGKDIQREKAKLENLELELKTNKGLLEEANVEINKFKEMDIDGIKRNASEWETKYNNDIAKLQEEIKAKDFEYNARDYLDKYKFTSDLAKKAVIAEFKAKNFQYDNGVFLGADDFMNQLKESNPNAFVNEETKQLPNVVKSTSNGESSTNRVYTRAEIEKMTPAQINANWSDVQASLKII